MPSSRTIKVFIYAKQCNLRLWDDTKHVSFQEHVNVTEKHFQCLWLQHLMICFAAQSQLLELAYQIFTYLFSCVLISPENPNKHFKWQKMHPFYNLKCLENIFYLSSTSSQVSLNQGNFRRWKWQSPRHPVPQNPGSHDNLLVFVKSLIVAPSFLFVTTTAITVPKALH